MREELSVSLVWFQHVLLHIAACVSCQDEIVLERCINSCYLIIIAMLSKNRLEKLPVLWSPESYLLIEGHSHQNIQLVQHQYYINWQGLDALRTLSAGGVFLMQVELLWSVLKVPALDRAILCSSEQNVALRTIADWCDVDLMADWILDDLCWVDVLSILSFLIIEPEVNLPIPANRDHKALSICFHKIQACDLLILQRIVLSVIIFFFIVVCIFYILLIHSCN